MTHPWLNRCVYAAPLYPYPRDYGPTTAAPVHLLRGCPKVVCTDSMRVRRSHLKTPRSSNTSPISPYRGSSVTSAEESSRLHTPTAQQRGTRARYLINVTAGIEVIVAIGTGFCCHDYFQLKKSYKFQWSKLAFKRYWQGCYKKHEIKSQNIQEHFGGGGRILYFFKNIIAHKNSLQIFTRFNDIYFSIIFQLFFLFLITITGYKHFKNIQEHSVKFKNI